MADPNRPHVYETPNNPIRIKIVEQKLLNAEQYEQWITKHLPKFSGDIHGAAKLLEAFTSGMTIATEKYNAGRVYVEPKLALNMTPAVGAVITSLEYGGQYFAIVRQDYLEATSLEDPYAITIVSSDSGPDSDMPALIGTMPQLFKLGGAQMVDHCYFFQRHHEDDYLPIPGGPVPYVEYDAQPHQYRALLLQREIAITDDMPKETLDVINWRLNKAFTYRPDLPVPPASNNP